MANNNKNSFIMLKEWGEQLQFLDNDQTAELFRMIFIYQAYPEDGVPVSDYPIVNSIFLTMRNFFDANDEKYEDMCEKRREAGSKGGKARAKNQANATFASNDDAEIQANQANATFASSKSSKSSISESESESESEYESESESDTEEERAPKGAPKKNAQRSAPFCPPAVEEVKAYITEKGYHVDAEAFVDYYQSVKWFIGRNKKMGDWKAAVRTWEHREKGREPPDSGGSWMDIAQEVERRRNERTSREGEDGNRAP